MADKLLFLGSFTEEKHVQCRRKLIEGDCDENALSWELKLAASRIIRQRGVEVKYILERDKLPLPLACRTRQARKLPNPAIVLEGL